MELNAEFSFGTNACLVDEITSLVVLKGIESAWKT